MNISIKKLLFVLSLCIAAQSQAQWFGEKIEGKGGIKKETRKVGSFHAVSSSGFWDVVISYGESGTIEIEGDANMLQYVETEVENGRLSIHPKPKYNLHPRNKLTVYISMTRLTSVSLSGSGDIIGKGKFSNDGNTDFKLSGSGDIHIDFDKTGSAGISISGSGNVRLSGMAKSVTASVSGSGNVDCHKLVADDATAKISGSGNVRLHANKTLDASINGSGNVSYRGTATTDVRKRVAGSGSVVRE